MSKFFKEFEWIDNITRTNIFLPLFLGLCLAIRTLELHVFALE